MEYHGSEKGFSRSDAELFGMIKDWTERNGFDDAEYFVKYPLFRVDSEVCVVSQGMLVCKEVGVIIFASTSATGRDPDGLRAAYVELDSVSGYLSSRLMKNPSLRKRTALKFNIVPVIFSPNFPAADAREEFADEAIVVTNQVEMGAALDDCLLAAPLDDLLFRDLIGTIDAARSIVPVSSRQVSENKRDKKVKKIADIESSIRDFDGEQKRAFLSEIRGFERIRGLAGSGKTVILAHKVALLHVNNPEAVIVYTYYTKALKQTVKRLISRFYSEYSELKPNWGKIRIMHAWGGRSDTGLYFEYSQAVGVRPLNYSEARNSAPRGMGAFEYACSEVSKAGGKKIYDYIFVDEAQDFGPEFLKLCFTAVPDQKVVIGLDIFQNIFQINAPDLVEIIGADKQPEEDIVLRTCYRTPRNILVCAHALGLGVYKKPVQVLESLDHWSDIGYEHIEGELVGGARVRFERPTKYAPLLAEEKAGALIKAFYCAAIAEETEAIGKLILADIKDEGLFPEDVMVICADDYNCRSYFSRISDFLLANDIAVNNTQLDNYSVVGFSVKDRVTLTTLNKAKGNEAYSVYVVGIDALYSGVATSVTNRNRVFTAMTRTKGWLTISGVGDFAKEFCAELEVAMENAPVLDFEYPDDEAVRKLKRDLKLAPIAEQDELLRAVIQKYGADFVKDYLSTLKDKKEK